MAAAQAARGEEIVENPDAYADPDDEKNIFAGTVYEQDDEEADRYVETISGVQGGLSMGLGEAEGDTELTTRPPCFCLLAAWSRHTGSGSL